MPRIPLVLMALAMAGAAFAPHAGAAEDAATGDKPQSFAAVSKLVAAGQTRQAMAAVEQALKARPRDPQWRFLQGRLLTIDGQTAQAIAVFTSLTEDFPDLPEPHNNLAVLQAADGKTALARSSLEAAVRADPAYAVAHENLGEIQLRLAIEAYQRALDLGGNRATIEPRLKQLRQVLAPSDSLAPPPARP